MDLQLNTHIDISKVNAGLENLSGTLRRAVERGLTRATVLLRNAVQTNIRSPYGDKPPAVAFGDAPPVCPVGRSNVSSLPAYVSGGNHERLQENPGLGKGTQADVATL